MGLNHRLDRQTLIRSCRDQHDGRTWPVKGRCDRVLDEDLSRAVVAYLRGSGSGWPRESPEAVVKALGVEAAKHLVPRVQQLAREAVYWPVDWQQHDDVSAMRAVEHEIAEQYPQLDADAVSALGWHFSYCNKLPAGRRSGRYERMAAQRQYDRRVLASCRRGRTGGMRDMPRAQVGPLGPRGGREVPGARIWGWMTR
jgi:hypothetical protein